VDREQSAESGEGDCDTGGGVDLEAVGDRWLDVVGLGVEFQEVLPGECCRDAGHVSARRDGASASLASRPEGGA
ncbi:MAG: hypothetical protein ACK583_18430, partial [Cyanobacteriota bacterium]